MASVSVDRVSRWYVGEAPAAGRTTALDDVSLEIADGETMCVLGPSGSGKSTLLRTVAGLDAADAGRVRYDGADVTYVPVQERAIGMVFQDYALYPSMRSSGNLRYSLDNRHQPGGDVDRRVQETADLMGIDFELLLGRLPDTLSGGEKQRVAIARCIVRRPSLFLMDEPLSALDAKLRERTRLELKKLLRRFAVSTLYVTHDQQEAIFMGDRVAVLRDGHLEQVGTYDELYYEPVNRFVAEFIGSPPMAVLPAAIGDGMIFVGQTGWPVPPEWHHQPPGEVWLGVRPEGWSAGGADGLPMTVRRIERLPAERAVFLRGAVGSTEVTALVGVDQPDVTQTRVTPDLPQAYLFDTTDGTTRHAPGTFDPFAGSPVSGSRR